MKEIKISSQALRELYEKIGEEAGLSKILERFYEQQSQPCAIGFFFQDKDLKKIANMQKAFLMRAWGITASYPGKSPAQAHEKLAPYFIWAF